MSFVKKIYALVLKLITLLWDADTAKKFDTRLRFRRNLDLKNPKTLADKVSYIELHEQSPLASKCTDKWEVRSYVFSKGLGHILVPEVGGPWKSFDEIDFQKLPDSFVLKATHGCKMNYIVENKADLNIGDCKKEANRWLGTTYGTYSMEPHYISIPHRIYAEKYLGEVSKLVDYKFHCINGEPEFILVITDRKPDGDKAMSVKIHMMDTNWNHIDEVVGFNNETAGDGNIPEPKHLKEMVECARILSKDFKFVRVDLYDTSDGILFGELTFTPAACVFPYLSESFLLSEGAKLEV